MTKPAHRNVARKHFCPGCDHFHPLPNTNVPGAVGVCILYPPTPFVIGMAQPAIANPGPNAPVIPVIRGYYPPVSAEDTCSQWTPRPAGEA